MIRITNKSKNGSYFHYRPHKALDMPLWPSPFRNLACICSTPLNPGILAILNLHRKNMVRKQWIIYRINCFVSLIMITITNKSKNGSYCHYRSHKALDIPFWPAPDRLKLGNLSGICSTSLNHDILPILNLHRKNIVKKQTTTPV